VEKRVGFERLKGCASKYPKRIEENILKIGEKQKQ
jgi:hypothetical protein